MDESSEVIQQMQNTLGRLRMRYSEAAPAFWALRLAWEAVRVAWYVVTQQNDGGKLDLVEGALKDLTEQLQKGVEHHDRGQ